MLQLQMQVGKGWMSLGYNFMQCVPEDVDALAWCRKQFPSSDFRVVWVRDTENAPL